MKKNQMLIVAGVVLLAVLALFFFMRGGNNPIANLASTNPGDLITNALTGSASAKCEYTNEDGSVVTAYVKGGRVRTDIVGGPDGGGSFLMKDKTTWTWSDTTKTGVMYNIPDVTPVEGEVEEVETGSADAVKTDLEQYKESCKSENVPDSLFEVPTDVNFQDFSSMMQQGMEQQMQEVPQEYQQYLNQQ